MRILVGATLFLLVVLIISNDASAKKSVREKSERNKRSTTVGETSREKDASANYKKKSPKMKNHEEPRAKKRRSIDEVESEVTGKDNSGSGAGEEKYSKKSHSTEQRNKNHKRNEAPSKYQKNTKRDKTLDSTDSRSFKKSSKSSTLKKRSPDDSHISENNGDYSSCKISPSKPCSKNYKPAKYVEKRENSNHVEYEEEDEMSLDEEDAERVQGRYGKAKNKRGRENNLAEEERIGKTYKKDKKNRDKMEKSQRCASSKYDENKSEKSTKKYAVDKSEEMDGEFELENKHEKSKEIVESETDDLWNEEEEGEENEKMNQEEEEEEEEVNEDELQD